MIRCLPTVAFALLVVCAPRSIAQAKLYSLPEKTGALIITAGMDIREIELRDEDSQLRMRWDSPARHMIMTAFIQPAEALGDSTVCRRTWWPQTKQNIVRVAEITEQKFREQGRVAMVEYMVPSFAGSVNQKHVHAYLAGGDVWVEVHISKEDFKPEDQALFDTIVSSLHVNPNHVTTSTDYWAWGAISSDHQEYEKATRYFQKSLDLEKKSPGLEPWKLRRMIADLGHFYTSFNDLARAQEALEYGLSKYPDYPLIHYNMACVIALRGKMDDSLAELRLAYRKPEKADHEEDPLPEPLKDEECFSKFAREPRFIQAVREMQKNK